ncbi:cytochrome c biogenesis protein CcdA [Paraflavisolibacter sp. H34]|uniref:protein-disulfide reductase DsbD family protein n=1 Tax=Huijunlia imazamoxiresistens TaxID=3127457 RepID=UPI0030162AF0
MTHRLRGGLFLAFLLATLFSWAQNSAAPFKWTVRGKKLSENQFELAFSTPAASGWQLYAPTQLLGDVPAAELQFADSAIRLVRTFGDSGTVQTVPSTVFGSPVKVYRGAATWRQTVQISGTVPATLQGTLLYTYGRADELYPSTAYEFSVPLEGGTAAATRILIPTIDIKNPVAPCGDDDTAGKSLAGIFLLGFAGGLIALITPCVFPLIPLTVSFFTKRSGSRSKGLRNAALYGLSIFLIYVVLSLPFHIVDQANPEVLNNISTNIWLNLAFFVVFIFFALSFFGFYEIGLPGGFASKIDARAGLSDFWGIFFMALTLAIVSFSCTGPILGSLLAGALTNNGGAVQLSFGMGGFGLGLALPFALFALFPGWLQSLPRSGGWLHTVKVVLGFLELALAVKFLSNADLVKQWGLLKREVFIGIWVLIGIAIVLYLLGVIRFAHDQKKPVSPRRWVLIGLFAALTLYLVPGVTNTRAANLRLISGFPPPLCYSVYPHPVNCERSVEPLRDYDEALKKARELGKPLLIDFTGWACVNCRRMEEKVWTDPDVIRMMKEEFVLVSLYVDERQKLPLAQQVQYTTKTGMEKSIVTIGDKWATFQSENFNAVSQPQYAIISPEEKALTKTKAYTPSANEFADWLRCGLGAFKK